MSPDPVVGVVSLSRNRLLNVMRYAVTSSLSLAGNGIVHGCEQAWVGKGMHVGEGSRGNVNQSVRRAGAGGPVSHFDGGWLPAWLDR